MGAIRRGRTWGRRPVGVHLEDDRGVARERDLEPVEVRRPDRLARPVADADPWIVGGEPVRELAGPVRRGIVHDEQRAARQRFQDRRGDAGQVLDLVVGGQQAPHTPLRRPGRNPQARRGRRSWRPSVAARSADDRTRTTVVFAIRPRLSLALIVTLAAPVTPAAVVNVTA